ncbi:S8 family serine peptidase [Noviherbaspirillum sp. L7-7A]|uniref:S8 family serine peptidase n=1 Tax=Noviherbaspirillum sp. L7-7A TaxID=2850560 RepID=UPI0020127EBD|nr:S8 family serine peptidase [Noviherbaspirillum sp. L7-7A]
MNQQNASKFVRHRNSHSFLRQRAIDLACQAAFLLPSMLVGAAVLQAPAAIAAQPVANSAEQYARGRILVMPRAGLSEAEFVKALAPHGGRGKKIGQSDLHVVELPANASEKAVVERLSRHPHIKFAELDRLVKPNFVSNDPYMGSEWHLNKVGATTAWDTTQGAGVIIAILDSGVDGTHPDLAPQMVPGYNFYDNNTNTSDVNGHGTAVAGVAAAATNNALGVAGVAGQAKIMPVRIADANAYAYYSTIAKGVTYAADNGARVVNCSYGGVAGSSTIQSAAQYLKNKGGLMFVSAGNNGVDENITPTTTMIAVSATDENDYRTSWSSYGNFVSMAAPGITYTTSRGGYYDNWQGTSFSSPLTAGVAALMMAAKPSLGSADIEKLMFSTAVDIGAAGRDIYYGYGRVNAAAAVQAAVNTTVAVDTQAPAVSISNPIAYASVTGVVPVNVSATDNVGVARVELKVNGSTVSVDSAAPFAFSWDSASVPNGMANLVAYAYDAAGNVAASTTVAVNVANGTTVVANDTTAPKVKIANPVSGKVSGNVSVSSSAEDDSGAAGITQWIYIDGTLVATGKGSSLAYNWNTRKASKGTHAIAVTARDAAGNTSTTSVSVMN